MSGCSAPPVPDSAGRAHATNLEFFCLIWSSTPQVFTNTLAPLVAWLRLLEVQLYVYFDDLLIVGDSKVTQPIQKTIRVLVQAGFVVNLMKYELAPTQDLAYIGAKFCMDLGRLYFLEMRIQALTTCVRSFSKVGAYKPAHQFQSLPPQLAEEVLVPPSSDSM